MTGGATLQGHPGLTCQRRYEIFGDPRLTAAPLGCLIHCCHIIKLQGDLYPFSESLHRKEKDRALSYLRGALSAIITLALCGRIHKH